MYHGAPRQIVGDHFIAPAHFGTLAQAKQRSHYWMSFSDKPTATVYEVELDITKPKRVEDVGGSDQWQVAIEDAIEEGFNGLVYENQHEGHVNTGSGAMKKDDSWVAFENAQIKIIRKTIYNKDGTVFEET
jgi:hypothetical protein